MLFSQAPVVELPNTLPNLAPLVSVFVSALGGPLGAILAGYFGFMLIAKGMEWAKGPPGMAGGLPDGQRWVYAETNEDAALWRKDAGYKVLEKRKNAAGDGFYLRVRDVWDK